MEEGRVIAKSHRLPRFDDTGLALHRLFWSQAMVLAP
jgi:hypothetical protein